MSELSGFPDVCLLVQLSGEELEKEETIQDSLSIPRVVNNLPRPAMYRYPQLCLIAILDPLYTPFSILKSTYWPFRLCIRSEGVQICPQYPLISRDKPENRRYMWLTRAFIPDAALLARKRRLGSLYCASKSDRIPQIIALDFFPLHIWLTPIAHCCQHQGQSRKKERIRKWSLSYRKNNYAVIYWTTLPQKSLDNSINLLTF